MIEGLKVTVNGHEVITLCENRAAHHRERAKVYADQVTSMEKNQIEGMNYSGGNPLDNLRQKQEQHEDSAAELDFIAKHILPAETYLLDREALHKLGISQRRF